MAYSAKYLKESLGQGEDMERDEERVEPHISGVRNLSETACEMRAAGRKLVNEDDDKEKDIDDYDRLSGAVKKLQESVDAQKAEVAQTVKRMNQILYEMRGLVDEVERIYTDARDESHSAEQAALNGVNKAQENREVYIAWLREKLEDYCNDDGSYEVYWDYDDSITPDQLVEAVDNWKSEGYTSPESYLASTLYDTVGEAQESQLYVSILDDLNDAPDEVRACWDESTGIWDDLYEAGYTGIDMNLDDLLSRSSFNVNLFFATETEKNFDMGSIVDSFGNDYREPRLEDIDAESLDNALSYLVNQQGHSVEEVFGNPDNAFIHSIREEIVENSSEAMSELCALVRMDAREMLDLIGKRSEAKGSLVLPRDCATMGIFNQWSGCGGVLDILLEKDAVMPLSMIRGFQIEGQSDPEGYTVNDVYGLVGSCWKPAQLSDDIETDVKEDYALALQKARATDWEIEEQEAAEPVSLKSAAKEARAASEALAAHGAPTVDLEHEAEDARKASEALSCTHDDH